MPVALELCHPSEVLLQGRRVPSVPRFPPQVMHMFKGCRREDTSPHIYAVAQAAYRSMLMSRQDQAVVLLGASGSGKTTNCQHLVQYLATIAGSTGKVFSGECAPRGPPRHLRTPSLRGHGAALSLVSPPAPSPRARRRPRAPHRPACFLAAEKWQALYTVLEAFGNSSTSMNGNATRFSQIISLDFDQAGQVASASVQVRGRGGPLGAGAGPSRGRFLPRALLSNPRALPQPRSRQPGRVRSQVSSSWLCLQPVGERSADEISSLSLLNEPCSHSALLQG